MLPRKVLASLFTLHPPPGCSSSWGKLSIPPPLCARLYPPPGKVARGCLLAPPERGSRVRSRQCRPLGAKALCSELSCRGLRSGSYWNSRFKRCLNDLIKAAEENVQAVRSCSSDEEVLAVLVLLCRGYGWGGQGENLSGVYDFILFEQEKWIAVLCVLLNPIAGVEQLSVERWVYSKVRPQMACIFNTGIDVYT